MLEKNFNSKIIEEKWSKLYEEEEIFKAGQTKDLHKKPYVIMMPPPNVTGALHNGHALFVTIQDILARFWRMKGYDVLWLPGTDHAGISTQTVVERVLKKEGKNKYDLGREEFLKRVFAWKDVHGNRIIQQLKMLGASADWSRLRFTMDEQCSFAVTKAFIKLWNDGLIHRKERLISWDPVSKTALSDEEVDHIERESQLVYFAYKLKNNTEEEIIVATTRLETMLGDVAVCINPHDDRYMHLIGQELIHPFYPNRKITIIADEYVDKEFGSGAVKITPAHDPNDFAIGQRHNLEKIIILDLNACINIQGIFFGLDRFLARKKIQEELETLGLLRKVEMIKNSVSISQRSMVEIEPMISKQYFVDAKPLAKLCLDAVNNNETNIIPKHFKKTWDYFLENIQDWCISRQLWWGHRIPVYYHVPSLKKAILNYPHLSCYQALMNNKNDEEILAQALEELDDDIIRKISFAYEKSPDSKDYIQENDVLDTWFSSGLWPFSTLGWPNNTPDLQRYYPSAVLETGSDILFFWVARMMMFGIYFMNKPPFKDIFLHSMVRDAHGKKMSKSLGNAIDPQDIIDGITLDDLIEKTKTYPVIPSHLPKVLQGLKKDFPSGIPSIGADGLRLSLAIFCGQGQDVKFSIPRVIGYKAFLTKVWNATRFALMNIDENIHIQPIEQLNLSLPDSYIISKLNQTIIAVDKAIEEYNFSEAAESVYHFFWNEYCDIYIECAKSSFKDGNEEQKSTTASVLMHLLDASMRLLHPFCPFISEEIWHVLPASLRESEFLATANYAKIYSLKEQHNIEDMQLIISAVSLIRNLRQTSQLPSNQNLSIILAASNNVVLQVLQNNQNLLKHLAKVSEINWVVKENIKLPSLYAINTSAQLDIIINLEGLIDPNEEKKRITKALEKLSKDKTLLLNKLENQGFVEKAPKEILQEYQNNLKDILQQEAKLTQALNIIN